MTDQRADDLQTLEDALKLAAHCAYQIDDARLTNAVMEAGRQMQRVRRTEHESNGRRHHETPSAANA